MQFIDRFMSKKNDIRSALSKGHPENYNALVTTVIQAMFPEQKRGEPDFKCVHEIDDGDRQGTLVYVIGEACWQPHNYWYCRARHH